MLNPFPDLLVFSFFAPTLLRIVAAVSFLAIGYVQIKRRNEIGKTHFPIIGAPGAWLAVVVGIAAILIGLMLFFGYYTQYAALAGIVLGLKHIIYAKKYPRAIPLCRVDYIYLIVICASLLLLGAGAFAQDLPL